MIAESKPPVLVPPIAPLARRSFRKHLFERDIARHTPEEVASMGRSDIDALSTWLGARRVR